MAKHQNTRLQFAICINSDDPDLLTPRMVYQVLPDDSAAKSNYIRVIDNEGEDYLYPANYFILVDFPHAIEHILLRALQSISQCSLTEQEHSPNVTQNPA